MKKNILFKTTRPDRHDFLILFESTGWNQEYRFSEEQLDQAVRQSWHTVSAYDQESLIGFGRIISDGTLHALVVDLIVFPAYHGKGVGSTILKQLVERCKAAGIPDIQLFCAKGKSAFYEKKGFTPRPLDAPGMEMKWKLAQKIDNPQK